MDINAIKSRMSALQNSGKKKTEYEKVDWTKITWKPKQEGKYQIRFVPSKLNPKFLFQEVFVHYGYGKFPIYALNNWGEKDPIIEFATMLKEGQYDKENWILSNKLMPKLRVFAPIIVRGEEEKGVRLWEFGKEMYLQLMGIANDEDYENYEDINEGRDFTVEAVYDNVGGRQQLKCSIRIKPKQTPASSNSTEIESWLTNQPEILKVQRKYTYEQLKDILGKFLSPGEEDSSVSTESVPIELVETETEEDNLPFPKGKSVISNTPEFIEEKKVKKVAATKAKTKVKAVDKFDELFDQEDKK